MSIRANLNWAKEILNPRGMTISYKSEVEEYRVNFQGGTEDDAYYTNDFQDAMNTGIAMADRRDLMKQVRLCAGFEAIFSNGQTEARPLA